MIHKLEISLRTWLYDSFIIEKDYHEGIGRLCSFQEKICKINGDVSGLWICNLLIALIFKVHSPKDNTQSRKSTTFPNVYFHVINLCSQIVYCATSIYPFNLQHVRYRFIVIQLNRYFFIYLYFHRIIMKEYIIIRPITKHKINYVNIRVTNHHKIFPNYSKRFFNVPQSSFSQEMNEKLKILLMNFIYRLMLINYVI